MKWLRRGATVLGILVAVPLLLMVVLLAAVQLPVVQSWLAAKVAELTADTDMQVQITGLGGSIPFSPSMGRLTLADRQGVWLEADQARLDVAWTELFAGVVHVRNIGAQRIAMLRTPVSTSPEPPPEPFSLPDPTALPRSIPKLLVDRLHIDRIELARPVLGEPAVLTLDGALTARNDGKVVDTRLDLRRIDQPDLTLALSGIVDLATQHLDVDLTASETGGLTGKLAGLPHAGDLQLSIRGDGPLDDWRGRLDLDLANVAAADADLMLGIADQATVGIDGEVRPAAGLLPADMQPLVGDKVDLALRGHVAGDGAVQLDQLRVVLAALQLSGQARVPADENGPSGRFTADIPDLGSFAGLAGTDLDGRLQAILSLGGTRAKPAAELRLDGADFRFNQISLAKLDSELDLQAGSPLGETLDSGDFNLTATASGLDLPGVDMPEEGPLTLSAAGAAERDGQVRLAELNVVGLGATLRGQADIDTDSLQGNGTLRGDVPSLGVLQPFLPPDWQALAGHGSLDLAFATTDAGGGDGDSSFSLKLAELDGLPLQFREVLGPQVTVAAQALIEDFRHITVNDLSAETAAVTLDGQGAVDLDGGPVSASIKAVAADLGRFAALAGQPLAGRANLDVDVTGTSSAPAGTAQLRVNELAGLPDDVAAVLGSSPSLQARAARREDGTLSLDQLELQTASAVVDGTGSYVPTSGAISGVLNGRAEDLAFLGRWLGGEPHGSADLQVRATGTTSEPAATVAVRADGLSGLPARYADLVGDKVTLDMEGSIAPAEDNSGIRLAQLARMELRMAALSATGSGAYNLGDEALQGTLQVDMPDLSKASAIAATDLAGRVRVDMTADRSLAQPKIQVRLDGEDIHAAGRRLGKVTARLDGEDLIAAPGGTLELAVAPGQEPLTLKARFRKDGPVVALPTIELRGPGRLALDGDFTIQTAPVSATGKLVGGVRDLGALEPFAGVPLQGRLDLDLQANGAAGQSAKASVRGNGLGMPGVVTVDALTVEAALSDLLATPGLRADLVADGIERPGVELTRTTLRASGSLEALTVTASTNGKATVPLQIEAGANVRRDGDRTVVDLTMLAGTIADKPLRLQQAARIELSPTRTALSNLDLRYDQASLSGSVALASERADGSIRLRGLDLAALQSLGVPPLSGQVQADLALAGTLRAPRIELTGRGRGIGVNDGTVATGTPLDLDLTANTTGSQVSGELNVSGLGQAPLQLRAQAPLTLSLQPFNVALPPDGPLAGALTGSADLARIARFAALDGQRVQGALVSDLHLSGTLNQPAANGSLQIRDATFADTGSGVALRNLDLALQATGRQIRIERLSATDGGSGRLSGSGNVDLGRPHLPFQVSIRLDEFRPVYRDDLLLRLGGDLNVTGDSAAANVTGRFLVDRAEISIPDGGTGGTIPVIEPTTGPGAPAESEDGTAGLGYQANLDITVDMPERIFV
ncbi:MAG TPA: translocation/assembly module TamB domain-containing protein, partial [Geminicoccus sp.]|uniref:translocation/assembly module TamB domain-containing protein n=1 Tax=Geminicoccus sp. TaxID=2024832 RepID=UPI002E2F5C99